MKNGAREQDYLGATPGPSTAEYFLKKRYLFSNTALYNK
jgi:hypothetical protein